MCVQQHMKRLFNSHRRVDAALIVRHSRVRTALSRYVIRRYGTPEGVAALTAFLCSNAASWITGQTYPLNGGYSFAV